MKKKRNFIVEAHDEALMQQRFEKVTAPNDGDAVLIFSKKYPGSKIEAVYAEV